MKYIPYSFSLVHADLKDLIVDPAELDGMIDEWTSFNDVPIDPPTHPYITWMYFERVDESSRLHGFYTGPVYVYEEEWNKDWGILVEDNPVNAEEEDDDDEDMEENRIKWTPATNEDGSP